MAWRRFPAMTEAPRKRAMLVDKLHSNQNALDSLEENRIRSLVQFQSLLMVYNSVYRRSSPAKCEILGSIMSTSPGASAVTRLDRTQLQRNCSLEGIYDIKPVQEVAYWQAKRFRPLTAKLAESNVRTSPDQDKEGEGKRSSRRLVNKYKLLSGKPLK
jgi:hypothetical protein